MLTFLTVLAGAALGGGALAGLTILMVAAVVALVLIAAANGLRSLHQLTD